uniref:Putative disease resistance protein RGA1 n=1 Tax=Populus alba TaxID=43335 RepID=A0A4V6A891_POPAL|nr:putative disease resistance protein RGA1 [Populus alba]
MAEGVLFNIAEEIIKTLGSLAAQEVALWWGLKDQLRKLNGTVTSIKAVIQDAEEQAQKQNHQIEVWLKKLREAVYDAEDLLDDFSTQVLRKQLMLGKRVSREVRPFFSRSNQFVYGLRMGHRVKALRERLDDIETDSKRFSFVARQEEGASLTTVREQTTSSEPEEIVGREGDKVVVKTFLMNSNYEQNVSVISVVGMGGLGKTTLAQHVFNDKQVKAHFGVRLWVCVSGSLNVRKIIKGAVVKRDGLGNIRSCEMDDFMHDLATKLAGTESIKVERGGNRISELTRHVSFDTDLNLSLPFAKRLRTLVLLKGGKWDEGSWKSICRDFGLLRVLVLSHLGMKEVPPLIEKLKHLKYLDLSNNEMEVLSNSVTNLVKLQVLKLNGCRKLKELPRDIGKLINLRQLDVGCYLDDDLCENLEYMPRGIGKLTSLQTLSCFVAAKNRSSKSVMIGGLDELSALNKLRGRLEITVKGYEGSSCISEFEGAKLIDKEYLQSLTVKWDIGMDNISDIDLYGQMLRSLQPNSSLQELKVRGYKGIRFPHWLSELSNLVSIHLIFCPRLKHIPPLDKIPYVRELLIMHLNNLEYMDSEGGGGRGVSGFFPSLKKLSIYNCPNLKGWWKKSRDEMSDDIDESLKEMLCFPCLSSLSIVDCPNLTSMPLFPTLSILILLRASSKPLQQTMEMTSPVSSSSSSSSFTRHLSKLKNLFIYFIDDTESLRLQNLSSLQQLSIRGCSRLNSLPLPSGDAFSSEIKYQRLQRI